ncbi:MAG: stage 0 sporulation family protein [Deltaproteobacteria bacterium]|nr:stage 0 sporulation family protein [Deltaproteobacteria bacterium]
MGKIVQVRFKSSGKSYDFDCGAFVLEKGDQVIVETEQGLGFGTVTRSLRRLVEGKGEKPLKKVFRKATEEDVAQHEKNLELEQEAYAYCEEQIEKLKLPMNLFSVDSTFDASKITFFFTAEGRVDFRELVRVLVRRFRRRIELRQIGVRHQAKMCGGLGRCGRETCCTTFMTNFVPVSVKMAKVQNLSLNPTKISGLCGRLMCCLTFEHETYQECKKDLPKPGRMVETPEGRGKVTRHNVVRRLVSVRLGNGREAEFSADDVRLVKPEDNQPPRAGKGQPGQGGEDKPNQNGKPNGPKSGGPPPPSPGRDGGQKPPAADPPRDARADAGESKSRQKPKRRRNRRKKSRKKPHQAQNQTPHADRN